MILTSFYPKKKKKIPLLLPHGMWLAYGYGRSPKKCLLLPPPPPLNLPSLRRSRKISATTPSPPTESAKLTAIPKNFCYYPPPPPNLVGLRRSRKIGPPQKKILATPLSVNKLLHYRAGGLLHYRAFLLHYRALIILLGVFITLSGTYSSIGRLLHYRLVQHLCGYGSQGALLCCSPELHSYERWFHDLCGYIFRYHRKVHNQNFRKGT